MIRSKTEGDDNAAACKLRSWRARRAADRGNHRRLPRFGGGAVRRQRSAGDPAPGCALDLRRIQPARHAPGGRTAPARPAAGRPDRHLVAEPRRMGADPVRHRQGRPDHGEHQPVVSPLGTGVRARQGALQRADPGAGLQVERLHRHAAGRRARTAPRQARRAAVGTAAEPAPCDPAGRRQDAGHVQLRRAVRRRSAPTTSPTWRTSQRRCSSTIPSTSSSRPAPPARRRARR